MPSTLLLARDTWDLCVDARGNIAVASEPYALAQDAASAIRLFQGELWYDTGQGVPYFSEILGQAPPLSFLKASFVTAALTVPGVVSAVCFISGIVGRTVTGQVQVTDASGNVTVAAFGASPSGVVPRPLSAPLDVFVLDRDALA
jgi:tetrahydromethanopterin S-methyltransferase subunit D